VIKSHLTGSVDSLEGVVVDDGGFFGFPDMFRGFDEMRTEIERGFENAFKNIQAQAPKDLVKYQTTGGGKVREYGTFT
jgi:hypothetical protein